MTILLWVFIFGICLTIIGCAGLICERLITKWILQLVVVIFWLAGTDFSNPDISSREYSTNRTIVSASPSNTTSSGYFILGSGSIGSKRYYLLREEIENGLYQDFEVDGTVYIRERETTNHKGVLEQKYICTTSQLNYRILWYVAYEKYVQESCVTSRQEIIVPVGYVIKDLNI